METVKIIADCYSPFIFFVIGLIIGALSENDVRAFCREIKKMCRTQTERHC